MTNMVKCWDSSLSDQELIRLLFDVTDLRIKAMQLREYPLAYRRKIQARAIGEIIMERVRNGTWQSDACITCNTEKPTHSES
jgi:hypothetical protein